MRLKIPLVFLAIAALVCFVLLRKGFQGVSEGSLAPSFSLASQGGVLTTLDRYRGRVVLLNFWATWCPPCVQEVPSLEMLKRQMEGKAFQILAVSVDEEGWPAIQQFLKKVPVTMMILLDARGDIASRYGVDFLPVSLLIDKTGRILKRFVGPRDWTEARTVEEIKKYVE